MAQFDLISPTLFGLEGVCAQELKRLDAEREANPDWYKQNDMLGMMLYIDNFAGKCTIVCKWSEAAIFIH